MNRTHLDLSIVFSAMGLAILAPFLIIASLLFQVTMTYQEEENWTLIYGLITVILLLMIVANIIAMVRLRSAKKNEDMRTEVLVWGIYLLFGGIIAGGIFGILASKSKAVYEDKIEKPKVVVNSLAEQIKDLERLYAQGLINQKEYEFRRKKVIEDIN